MNKLRFGTGGIPLTSKSRNALDGVLSVKELGLEAMELEFVYQMFVKKEEREKLKSLALENDIVLTVHGSYFINLASLEPEKIDASIKRVVDGAEVGEACGARSITFHPATFMGRAYEEVYLQVKNSFERIFEEYHKRGLTVKISPELTGKAAQFGDLGTLIRLVQEFEGENIGFCFDFAHKHARDGGGWNSYEEFSAMFKKIKEELGEKFLSDMHMHVSGINYTKKGERNHLTLLPNQDEYRANGVSVGDLVREYEEMEKKGRLETPDLNWHELLQAIKDNGVGGVLISESPNLEEDALLMKKYFESL